MNNFNDLKGGMRIIFLYALFIVLFFNNAIGQEGSVKCSKTQNKKAAKLLEDAKHQARSGASFVTVKATVDKALEEDADFIDA